MSNKKAGGLSYRDVGRGPKTLVLIHGFPLDHSMWRRQWDALSESHRVLTPDLRGFGDSEPLADADPLTMAAHADDLVAWLDAIGVGEPVAFAGLSMGGYIVFELWRRHATRVSAAALLDTKAVADTADGRAQREASAEQALAEGVDKLAEAMLPKLLGASAASGLREPLLKMMRHTSATTFAAAQRGMAVRQAATDLLPQMEAPCLVLAGAEDAISPPDEMRSFAEQMPRATFVEVAGAGHLAPWENPEPVNAALLAWLAESS